MWGAVLVVVVVVWVQGGRRTREVCGSAVACGVTEGVVEVRSAGRYQGEKR